MTALSDAMIALHGFEHAPLPPAARKLAMAPDVRADGGRDHRLPGAAGSGVSAIT
jgi:hypothetical protein